MNNILIVGLDHVIQKVLNQASLLKEEKQINSIYYSRDFSGFSAENCKQYNFHFYRETTDVIKNIFLLYKLIRQYKPKHIEFYLSNKSYVQLSQLLLVKMLGIPFIVWARGGELFKWDQFGYFKKLNNYLFFQLANCIVYKELYMPDIMKKVNITNKKRIFLPNTVNINSDWKEKKRKEILFLNSFKPWRNVNVVIDTMKILIESFNIKDYKMKIVGGSNNLDKMGEVECKLREMIQEYKLENYIEILPWTKEAQSYYDSAAFFLLPADIVFLNYSLLESMEQGVIPLVSGTDEGSYRIINNGKDGYIIEENDAVKYAEKLAYLINNRKKMEEISHNSRNKIHEHFSLYNNINELENIYNKIWK